MRICRTSIPFGLRLYLRLAHSYLNSIRVFIWKFIARADLFWMRHAEMGMYKPLKFWKQQIAWLFPCLGPSNSITTVQYASWIWMCSGYHAFLSFHFQLGSCDDVCALFVRFPTRRAECVRVTVCACVCVSVYVHILQTNLFRPKSLFITNIN